MSLIQTKKFLSSEMKTASYKHQSQVKEILDFQAVQLEEFPRDSAERYRNSNLLKEFVSKEKVIIHLPGSAIAIEISNSPEVSVTLSRYKCEISTFSGHWDSFNDLQQYAKHCQNAEKTCDYYVKKMYDFVQKNKNK